ncbi:hypothetical protein [Caballeronia sordidicola]|uniref:hypothetical protein n=1 Tax=Caballeronia sordidicola TaxID=196367 RepID=UPI00117F7FE7|nr:hypothetical protein [Caballeronia sordidicola]
MKKAVSINLRVLPVAVMNAVLQMHLYPVKSLDKCVLEVSEPSPPIFATECRTTDKLPNCTIGDPLDAGGVEVSVATAKLKTYTRAEMSKALKINAHAFDAGVLNGLYPDFDYLIGARRYWFEATLNAILARGLTDAKRCPKCEVIKPLYEFGLQRKTADGHVNICIDCVRQARESRNDLPMVSGMPAPIPYDAARVGHDKFETHRFLDDLRAKFGGVPTDIVRHGIVRRDQVTA